MAIGETGGPTIIAVSITSAQGIPQSATLNLEGLTPGQLAEIKKSCIIPKVLSLIQDIKKINPDGK